MAAVMNRIEERGIDLLEIISGHAQELAFLECLCQGRPPPTSLLCNPHRVSSRQ